jgi:hypothetical protein
MSGDIFLDHSADYGRSGSKKGKKDKNDKTFVFLALFALFVSSGSHHLEEMCTDIRCPEFREKFREIDLSYGIPAYPFPASIRGAAPAT